MKKTHVSLASASLMVGLTISSLGCSGDPFARFALQRQTRAPAAQEQVGQLVHGASLESMTQLLEKHPEAHFRVLNVQHGLYEVQGLNPTTLQREVPEAEISPNIFFAWENHDRLQSRLRALSQAASDSAPIAKCDESKQERPQAVIEIKEGFSAKDLEGETIAVGQTIKLRADKSTAHPKYPSPLRYAWVILFPEGAREKERLVRGKDLEIKIDSLGVYGVALITQDQRNVCGVLMKNFGSTANRPYLGTLSQPGEQPVAAPAVDHLADIEAEASWKLSQGQNQTIAIIDSGVHYNHPSLRANIAVNPKEIANNGIDDDKNGFVDDSTGWDFQFDDAFPYDDLGHGSHVAGLAASSSFGAAQKAKILPVKALGAFGGDAGSIAAGVIYAVDNGARIINLSLGSYAPPSEIMKKAINYAESRGAIVVASAGNGHPMTGIGINNDETPNYPSSLDNGNIIAVAAKGRKGALASYSNYGLRTVDVVVPGGGDGEDEGLLSANLETTSNSHFVRMSGTSMAAPLVSGIVAQVWALNPSLSPLQVKTILMQAGEPRAELKDLVASGRYLSAFKALKLAEAIHPSPLWDHP